ncbi:MAG: phosphate signaling complex protein PhoU [Ignavibacteriales bacterium]|nr:MAG: phosphate signaling complex protein PhoU [Ignavibacteriales bacterium]
MEQFDLEMDKLKKRVLKMCSLVEEQLQLSMKAFEDEDMEIARQVIEMDDKVDKYDVKIDKAAMRLLALRQPVASDLRYIISAMTINSNLERIGDISVNLAENFMSLKKKPSFLDRSRLPQMADLVKMMIHNAIDSFINNDPGLAKKVIDDDDLLDRYNSENHRSLLEIIKESPENAEAAVAILFLCREMERLGDHATNIAENVFFILEAHIIKHKYEKFLHEEDDSDKDSSEK